MAISAPYEGMGTVYVFISKEDGTGLNRNFVQVWDIYTVAIEGTF